MKIYRPVATDKIVQKFGENLAFVKLGIDNKPIRPFQVVANTTGICPDGYTPFYPAIGLIAHNGTDSLAYRGEPVYFPVLADGIEWQAATEIDQDGGIGVNVRSTQPVALEQLPPQAEGSLNLIKRQYDLLGGKVYLIFKFWHLQKGNVYDKQMVKPGDLIGWADSTGASSGDHLHWSMKISDETSWFCLDVDNGYTGAVDFDFWFKNTFILDILHLQTRVPLFTQSMHFGEEGIDIKVLQTVLNLDGILPTLPITGFYGNLTSKNVLAYQLKHAVDTPEALAVLQGKIVGPKTIAVLNKGV